MTRLDELREMIADPGEDCILWEGACDKKGYGVLQIGDGRTERAHRLVLTWRQDSPFEGAVALHVDDCIEPGCVNPRHLYWGTMKDSCAKRGMWYRGEDHHSSKLSEDDVLEIRRRHDRGESQRSISRDLGLSRQHLWRIVHREAWSHV